MEQLFLKPKMKQKLQFILSIFILSFCFNKTNAQTFYDLNTIQKIEISFLQPNWDYQLDTSKTGSEGYIMADWVKVNGSQYDSVGVKYKGNSSFDSTVAKNPLHISLDKFISQNYQGIKDIKLGNAYADPSMIREVFSYNILQNYMDCPKANFAQVYVNGSYLGLYSNAESIGKTFCADHFASSQNTFVKCNPTVTPGPSVKSNLKYITGADSTGYFNNYELKSGNGWNDLIALCDTITNNAAGLANIIDMDRVIWMLAFNNVLINLDSYSGAFAQNYYLYKDNTQRFNPIVWDLNMAFGGFPFVGSSNTSLGTLTIANMQQLIPTIHATDVYWPLIKDVMSAPTYKKMYMAHLRTITNEIFANNAYQSSASQLQTLVDTAVLSDANKFYTYADFQNAMTTNVNVGNYSVPGITTLMSARVSYLQSNVEFVKVAPVISQVTANDTTPNVNSTVSITAKVANTNSVYLGYRFNRYDKFVKQVMYDDGTHNDGSANDSIFGSSFNMNASNVQYYIYAENTNAGIFSPQRAEHEFYSLNAGNDSLSIYIAINEIMASNTVTAMDESNQYEDWVELYNKSQTKTIDLSGYFLSDNAGNLDKWQFPQGTTILPNDYLIIWLDQDATQGSLHANFKLSKAGDVIYLMDPALDLVDSVSFGLQQDDIGLARVPNGTGPFVIQGATFNGNNDVASVKALTKTNSVLIYPNPANNYFTISFSENSERQYEVLNTMGQTIRKSISSSNVAQVNTSDWSSGVYIFRSGGISKKVVISK